MCARAKTYPKLLCVMCDLYWLCHFVTVDMQYTLHYIIYITWWMLLYVGVVVLWCGGNGTQGISVVIDGSQTRQTQEVNKICQSTLNQLKLLTTGQQTN